MTLGQFLYNGGELKALHEDDLTDYEKSQKESYFLPHRGNSYSKYIYGVRRYQHEIGQIGGHRWKVQDFFINMTAYRKKRLKKMINERFPSLLDRIATNDSDEIVKEFKTSLKKLSNEYKEITGIYKKDLWFLGRGKEVAENIINVLK